MADDTVVTRHETEPATTHDVGEGGALGAVSGAIVGGLAGGPIGAVIGAVAGGAASAGAVDVVDKHDNDYARTVANAQPGSVDSVAPGVGQMVGTGGAYSDYDNDYRTHYQSNYAGTGADYDEYDPAYRYGHGLAGDARYQNQDWDTVESGARGDWESRQPGTWDRFKASVRHAYDRARAHV